MTKKICDCCGLEVGDFGLNRRTDYALLLPIKIQTGDICEACLESMSDAWRRLEDEKRAAFKQMEKWLTVDKEAP